jgi:hypothetical protein
MQLWLPRKIDYDVGFELPVRQTASRHTPRQSMWQSWTKLDRLVLIAGIFLTSAAGVFSIGVIVWCIYMYNIDLKYNTQVAAIPLFANETFPPSRYVEPGDKRPIDRDFCKLFARNSTWIFSCGNGLLVGGNRKESAECHMVVKGSDKQGWLEPLREWKVICSEDEVASVDGDLGLCRYKDLKVKKH